MFTTLLTSFLFLAFPDFGPYQVEPWYTLPNSDFQFGNMIDSAKPGRPVVRHGTAYDSANHPIQIDTLALSVSGSQWISNKRTWTINRTPYTHSEYTQWTTLGSGHVDSLYRRWWTGDSLTDWEHRSTEQAEGFLREIFSYGASPSSTTGIDTFLIRRDSLGRFVSKRYIRRRASSVLLEMDTVQWNAAGAPEIWLSRDSGASESRVVHHFEWSGIHLLSDSIVTTHDMSDPGTTTGIRVVRCVWKDQTLQSCLDDSGFADVQLKWDAHGQLIRKESLSSGSYMTWSWDSLGRNTQQQRWMPGDSQIYREVATYGTLPWPIAVDGLRCDTATGDSCTRSRRLEYSYSLVASSSTPPRTSHSFLRVFRSGRTLLFAQLPAGAVDVRLLDPAGRTRAIVPVSSRSTRIDLPSDGGVFVWEVRSDTRSLATGNIAVP